jgi:hypothetical protein
MSPQQASSIGSHLAHELSGLGFTFGRSRKAGCLCFAPPAFFGEPHLDAFGVVGNK